MTDLLTLVALLPLGVLVWAVSSFVRDLVEHRRWVRTWAADVEAERAFLAAVGRVVEQR